MDDYTHASRVFKPEWASPYSDAKVVKDIEVMRKEFNGTLFIDRVLRTLGIANRKWDAHAWYTDRLSYQLTASPFSLST